MFPKCHDCDPHLYDGVGFLHYFWFKYRITEKWTKNLNNFLYSLRALKIREYIQGFERYNLNDPLVLHN